MTSVAFGVVLLLSGLAVLLVFGADAESRGRPSWLTAGLFFLSGAGFVGFGIYRRRAGKE